MSPFDHETVRVREIRLGRRTVARLARTAPRQAALERLVWRDHVAEVLAVAEPADLVLACLLVEGLSVEAAAGRDGDQPEGGVRAAGALAEADRGGAAGAGEVVGRG